MSTILSHAWEVYRRRFGLIVATVVVVWLPLEVLSSYMDNFVFDPDDFAMSFKFHRLLDNLVGIIATAAVIWIGYSSIRGDRPLFQDSAMQGLRAWGRMFWTRLLSRIVMVLGFLLLILPGFYLYVRLSLAESVAVCERVAGVSAMQRSFELTRGRFWQVALLILCLWTLVIFGVLAVTVPVAFIPVFDHWLASASVSLVADVTASGLPRPRLNKPHHPYGIPAARAL